MAVITISRQSGSLGTIIAKMLKEELHFEYLDKAKIEEILVSEYGIPEEHVEKFDEKKPAFWDIFSSDKDRYLHFMKTAIYEFARKGNTIIIGRGGQVLLKDVPGALHVCIVAPTELRIERIKTRYNYNDKLAEQIIRHSDSGRTGFHKFFFHVNWEDSSLYDLILNTQTYSVEQAVNVIKASLDLLGTLHQQEETAKKLADLCLGQEIMTHIAYEEKIPIQFLEAQVQNGVVTLRGSTITSDDIQRCEAVARQVPGVKDVVNEIYFIPNTYGMA
ncbi:hypothetical protein U27_05391 [Candidatus Vecturithrix granuli]|uniref:BON domain-containing protein n=1 Tax=Vecturithrix granuli TaxID=1499967 RepID=A0A081C1G2_VECG1|nr:hypothetical protein U27_05391 [Candidatus Vecturithrix granuli]